MKVKQVSGENKHEIYINDIEMDDLEVIDYISAIDVLTSAIRKGLEDGEVSWSQVLRCLAFEEKEIINAFGNHVETIATWEL
jgi:hypothetical protein